MRPLVHIQAQRHFVSAHGTAWQLVPTDLLVEQQEESCDGPWLRLAFVLAQDLPRALPPGVPLQVVQERWQERLPTLPVTLVTAYASGL
jgi:hypothetical protein